MDCTRRRTADPWSARATPAMPRWTRRRPRSWQCFVIDMERHLDTDPFTGQGDGGGYQEKRLSICTTVFSDNHLRPLTPTKKPQPAGQGFGSFSALRPLCANPSGRRFESARNNNRGRRFRSDIILLLYLARAGRQARSGHTVENREASPWRRHGVLAGLSYLAATHGVFHVVGK